MSESVLRGLRNRLLQEIARIVPGARSTRVWLHRLRGVSIGQGAWIGYDCVLETAYPHLIRIGCNSVISVRVVLIAHFRGESGITIEDNVFIGPGAIVLPNVKLGEGCVVAAGSVVTTSVAPKTLVQGNPARPIATCGVSLTGDEPLKRFYQALRPFKQ